MGLEIFLIRPNEEPFNRLTRKEFSFSTRLDEAFGTPRSLLCFLFCRNDQYEFLSTVWYHVTYVGSQVWHQLSPFEGHLLILETPNKKEKFDQSKTFAEKYIGK